MTDATFRLKMLVIPQAAASVDQLHGICLFLFVCLFVLFCFVFFSVSAEIFV